MLLPGETIIRTSQANDGLMTIGLLASPGRQRPGNPLLSKDRLPNEISRERSICCVGVMPTECASLPSCIAVRVNDREFLQHLIKLRLERERKEAQAANAVKKPPTTAKSQKAKKKRSA